MDLSGLYQAFCFAFSMRYCLPSMKAVGISNTSFNVFNNISINLTGYISLRAQQSSVFSNMFILTPHFLYQMDVLLIKIPKYVYEFVGLTSLVQRILFINFMFENAKKYEHTEIDNKNSKVWWCINFALPQISQF